MNIYAISDLHLSTTSDKPMDIFGTGWEGHFEKIKSDWLAKVAPDDIVLIAEREGLTAHANAIKVRFEEE